MKPGLHASFVRRFAGGPAIRVEGLRIAADSGVTVVFGASGTGKTTLLRCLAGLERPDEGSIRFDERTWSDAGTGEFLAPRHRDLGFVPQNYALFPHLDVEQNIAYGLRGLSAMERRNRVAEAVRWLGLESLEKRRPDELSGGQQQRVAVARALVRRPGLLLLDEPLSALDAPTRQRLRGELGALLRAQGIPTVLVTHDRLEALALGDALVVMHDGRVVQQGPVREVFGRPATAAVADILAVETAQPGRVLSSADGLVTVAVRGTRLTALPVDLPAGTQEVIVCIRAEDVTLADSPEGRSSARNQLPAVVRGFAREGPLVRVDLDCGFPLIALLTKQGFEALSLVEGRRIQALIKAPDIHLIPRATK